MKSTDYAQKFFKEVPVINEEKNVEIKEAVVNLLKTYFEDFNSLVVTRKAQSNGAYISILKELSQKWAAMARTINEHYKIEVLRQDGFKQYCLATIPDLKKIWRF